METSTEFARKCCFLFSLAANSTATFGQPSPATDEFQGYFMSDYLRLLVQEIRVSGNEVRMTGSKATLMGAVLEKKMGTVKVPTSGIGWLPDLDSNQGPAD
jgi:hypothetical protein